jgi:hypothetical protein
MKTAANTRALILVGTVLTLVGIALSVGEDDGIASVITLAGLVLSIAALHRYGRLGPDASSLAARQD